MVVCYLIKRYGRVRYGAVPGIRGMACLVDGNMALRGTADIVKHHDARHCGRLSAVKKTEDSSGNEILIAVIVSTSLFVNCGT